MPAPDLDLAVRLPTSINSFEGMPWQGKQEYAVNDEIDADRQSTLQSIFLRSDR
jgi:hypothetical protein